MASFAFYLGIDYSGAGMPDTPLSGLRIYSASPAQEPGEIRSPFRVSGHWTRRELSDWLIAHLKQAPSSLIGIDHGFSFPEPYFERYRLPRDWRSALGDFCAHWPAHRSGATIRQLRAGQGAGRAGDSCWRRRFETYCGAKSIFHFDVPGSVAHSTHAGLAWLQRLLQDPELQPHVWPFDGWSLPVGRPVLAEVYPSLHSGGFDRSHRTADQHDAYSICAWFKQEDRNRRLPAIFSAPRDEDAAVARYEGWIPGLSAAPARGAGPLKGTKD